jgi:hypothetical protein
MRCPLRQAARAKKSKRAKSKAQQTTDPCFEKTDGMIPFFAKKTFV